MRGSTARRGSRLASMFGALAIAVLVAGCGEYEREFHITVDDERGAGGMLEAIVVNGEGFSPNGNVLVTLVLTATGGNTRPYVEETVQADSNGEFRFERRPVPCPQPPDYQSGSFTLVVARDEGAGISGSSTLEPGEQPDCRGGS